jgi:hypothetical protein
MTQQIYDINELVSVANYANKVGVKRQTIYVAKKYKKVWIDGHCFVDIKETEKRRNKCLNTSID